MNEALFNPRYESGTEWLLFDDFLIWFGFKGTLPCTKIISLLFISCFLKLFLPRGSNDVMKHVAYVKAVLFEHL